MLSPPPLVTPLGFFHLLFASFPVTSTGIEADAVGNVYVSDSGNDRVVMYRAQTQEVINVAGGYDGACTGSFRSSCSLA